MMCSIRFSLELTRIVNDALTRIVNDAQLLELTMISFQLLHPNTMIDLSGSVPELLVRPSYHPSRSTPKLLRNSPNLMLAE